MTSQAGAVWSTATLQRQAAQRARWRQTAVELGRALRHERRMAGLNQRELATLLGTTQGQVSLLERGDGTERATMHWCALADEALRPIRSAPATMPPR